MGMSTEAVGFKPPDEKWQKMKAIWDACEKGGVPVPAEVERFFGHKPPDPAGVEVSQKSLIKAGALVPLDPDDFQTRGFELRIGWLPEDVKIVRFRNSW